MVNHKSTSPAQKTQNSAQITFLGFFFPHPIYHLLSPRKLLFCFISFPSHLLSSIVLLVQLPSFRNFFIRDHVAGAPPPSPRRRLHAFVIIAGRVQHFLLSSTRVELCIHTLYRRFLLSIWHKKTILGWARTHEIDLGSCEVSPLDHREGRLIARN